MSLSRQSAQRPLRPRVDLTAETPERTAAFGCALAPALRPGDVVALSGALGAGKSHLARAVVRRWLGDPDAEVPSPSYTLVNIYASPSGDGAELWHADLYRISDADELAEIGLAGAPPEAILLVEWAERWPELPERRLHIDLAARPDDVRDIAVTAHGHGWSCAIAALRALQ